MYAAVYSCKALCAMFEWANSFRKRGELPLWQVHVLHLNVQFIFKLGLSSLQLGTRPLRALNSFLAPLACMPCSRWLTLPCR